MFTNILSTLTSFLPKNFIFASYVPVLVFGFINALLLFQTDGDFHHFAEASLARPLSLLTVIVFVASVVTAYVLTTVNDWLREVLEGKHLVLPIDQLLRSRQRKLCEQFDRELDYAQNVWENLSEAMMSKWENRLRAAAAKGEELNKDKRCSTWFRFPHAVRHFEKLVHSDSSFRLEDIEHAIAAMETVLERYGRSVNPALDARHGELIATIDEARDAAEGRLLRNYLRRHIWFGRIVEPTEMGNLVSAIHDYTLSRYGIDLDMFWSRYQNLIQRSEEKGYAALVDAKTQLDFLVISFWLSALSTLAWLCAFAALGTSLPVFVGIALGGLVLTVSFYKLALANYLAYGALIRAAVDLNRFALLRSLHLPLPNGIREERLLWAALRDISSLGSNVVEISYEHPSS